jgi:hypothetical protein
VFGLVRLARVARVIEAAARKRVGELKGLRDELARQVSALVKRDVGDQSTLELVSQMLVTLGRLEAMFVRGTSPDPKLQDSLNQARAGLRDLFEQVLKLHFAQRNRAAAGRPLDH